MSQLFSAQNGKIGFNKGFLGLIQPKDFNKINTALKIYNQRVSAANGQHKIFASAMKKVNPQLSQYLTKLNGGKANLIGYGASLVGATIKTVTLQAASIGLQAVLTWGIGAAISLIITSLQKLWKLVPTFEHLKEKLEETRQELQDIISEEKSLNEELETTQQRINELEGKGSLTFTEEAELTRLKQANAALERKLVLLDEERKIKSKDQQDTFKKTVESDFFKADKKSRYKKQQGHSGGWVGVDITEASYISEQFRYLEEQRAALKTATGKEREKIEKEIEKTEKYLSGKISTAQGYLDALEEAGYIYGTDAEVDKYIDWIYKFQDKYLVAVGNTSELFNSIINRDKFSEARTAIEELGTVTAESLAELYKNNDKVKELVDYLLSLGTIDWKTVLGEDFDRIAGSDGIVSTAEALGWMKENGENSAKVMGLVANEFNKVEGAAEGAATAVKKFSDIYDGVKDSYDIISEAEEEMKEHGFLSAETVSKMEKNGLTDYLLEVENGYQLVNSAMNDWIAAQSAKYQTATDTAINNALNLAKSQGKVADGYANSAEDMLAYIKALKETAIAEEIEEGRQYLVNQGFLSDPKEYQKRLSAFKNFAVIHANEAYDPTINAIEAAIANKKTWDRTLATLNRDKVNSNKDDDPNKTAAAKYFAELKYNLETNKITEEKYLKDLDTAYKKYYSDKSKYLDEFEQYSQEVYEGFKDMYKEDLEVQKEAWEEKKDAVSEYYDNLREQIENAHDEEDYEKAQSEKRKEIFDLDMQIAELMRDGSDKAKARIAELEEERLKAEEALLDFETDKAREDELSRLEKEQKAEEDKIQSQIDAIDEELQKIDGDIVDGLYNVRKTIVDYAAKKGITLDFAYATGTRSSVGGFGRINEKGIEMISAPDGNGNYVNLMPNSYVFSAKATEFLWKLATEHSLPQAMYNSIAKSIKTQSNTPSVNIAQPITITMGDVIIKGNADKQTVADIKKQQENTVRMVLQKIKELQK